MKKTLILTESDLVKLIDRIVESLDEQYDQDIDANYDEEDYVEAFLQYFRPWVRTKHGDEIGEYPLSYLIKKYMSEFAEDNGLEPDKVIYHYRNSLINAGNIGKNLVFQSKYKLPTLRSKVKFTDKFKKPLEFFLNDLNLPDYIKLNFVEDNPYDVRVEIIVDWLGLIKSKDEKGLSISSIKIELEKNIKNFLGIDYGNPTHGQLKLNFSSYPTYVGLDEWIQKDFNKEIKKKIKALPNAKRIIHSIKFQDYGGTRIGGEIHLSIKSMNWNGKHDLIKSIKDMLQSMGYNTNILQIH